MSREILFRGKRVDNGEWIYGSYIPNYHPLNDKHKDVIMNVVLSDSGVPVPHIITVSSSTVGQYTGLTDKNGVKIFEWDIAAFTDNKKIIEWKQDRLGFGFKDEAWRMLEDDGNNCEVIGNIHDNPELLKVED